MTVGASWKGSTTAGHTRYRGEIIARGLDSDAGLASARPKGSMDGGLLGRPA